MRALVIEDDTSTLRSIERLLVDEGWTTDTAQNGEEGFELGKLYDYDIIILDLKLPDIDGYDVLRRLRRVGVQTPLLILSGKNEITDKVRGLVTGADDYLTKPFNRTELIARLRAVIRRARGYSQPIVVTGSIAVNLEGKTVESNGVPIHLTSKEYQILELLCLRKGMTLTKEMFLDHLYGGMDEPEVKIIDVFICKLRKKLAKAADGQHCIETIWGRGYVLRNPPEDHEADLPKEAEQKRAIAG